MKDLLKAHNIKGFVGFDKLNLATLTYYKFVELGLVEKVDDRLTEVKNCLKCNQVKECPNAKSFCVDCLGIYKLVIKK